MVVREVLASGKVLLELLDPAGALVLSVVIHQRGGEDELAQLLYDFGDRRRLAVYREPLLDDESLKVYRLPAG